VVEEATHDAIMMQVQQACATTTTAAEL
jgi:hypothetical protein